MHEELKGDLWTKFETLIILFLCPLQNSGFGNFLGQGNFTNDRALIAKNRERLVNFDHYNLLAVHFQPGSKRMLDNVKFALALAFPSV